MNTNLEAVRAIAKARAVLLAAGAAQVQIGANPTPEVVPALVAPVQVGSWPVPSQTAPAAPPSIAAEVPKDRAPAKLVQFSVRLTLVAKTRLHGAALACHITDQEFVERLALMLPEPAPALKLPWEGVMTPRP